MEAEEESEHAHMRQLDLQVAIAAETVFQPSTFPLQVLPQLFDVLLKP